MKIYDLLRHPHPWVGPFMDLSLDQWVGSGQIINYLINLDLIEIIQFCLKIYNLLRHPHLWLVCMGGWVDGWVNMWVNGGLSGHITKNQINLELIEIIQFCLKIYDLLRHPHLWVGVWVDGWFSGSMGGVRSNY